MNEAPRATRVAATALHLLFFAAAALLALAPWLRPPLSADVGLLKTSPYAGVLLLALIALGGLAVLAGRVHFRLVAGALLSVSLAANVAIALNDPAFMERLDSEREQRQQVVRVLRHAPMSDPLSTPGNGRVPPADTGGDPLWNDLFRPFDYLLFGRWLVVWAALGVWFGTRRIVDRWTHLAGWTLLGAVLVLALCLPRLRAEYHWIAANRHELRGDLAAARRSLDATRRSANFGTLQRTWILLGKLDYLEGHDTPAAAVFRAAQLSAASTDIARLQRAVAVIEPALVGDDKGADAVKRFAARIHTQLGVSLFVRNPISTDSGLDYRDQERRLVEALSAWRRAMQLDPTRLDGRIYVSYTQALLDPSHPELAETHIDIADRMLRADVLNILGDAYFSAGRIPEARRLYAESLDLLNLPQRKNFRAQKGLGGI